MIEVMPSVTCRLGKKSLQLFRINGAQLRIRRRKVRENAGEKHNCTYRRREQMLKSFFHGFLPSEPNLTQNALIFFVHAHYIIFSGGCATVKSNIFFVIVFESQKPPHLNGKWEGERKEGVWKVDGGVWKGRRR